MSTPAEWDLILSAAQKNNADKIKRLIQQQGVPPSHANGVGQTALHVAALWGNVQAVAALLELGANLHAANSLSGATPLHMVLQARKAPLDKQEAVVDLLLQYKADVTVMDKFGCLPVDYLLQQQSIPTDAPLIKKLTPSKSEIISLVEQGQVEPLREYLTAMDAEAARADCNQDYRGKTAFTMALDSFVNACEPMDDDDGNDAQDDDTKIESMQQSWEILHVIIEAGGRQPPSQSSTTATEDIVDPPLIRVMECLLEANKNGNPNEEEIRIVQTAARALQKVSSSSHKDNDLEMSKARLLHDFARRNQLDLLRFACLELNWDVNGVNRQGMTALQFAARSGKLDALLLLLKELGADPGHKDSRGQTALDAARVNHKEDCVQALMEIQQ